MYVEMRDIETARTVKQRLNACDIYSGCCTLKIEYAKVLRARAACITWQMTRLDVVRNDESSFDCVGTSAGSFAEVFLHGLGS